MKPRKLAVATATLAVLASALAAATAQADTGCDLPPGVLEITDLPEGESVQDCDAVGRTVELTEDLVLEVPEVGTGIHMTHEYVDSPPEDFGILVEPDGTIDYESASHPAEISDDPEEDHLSAVDSTSGSGSAACSDGAYTDKDEKQYYQWLWYLGDGKRPDGMSTDTVVSRLKDAVNNITDSYNDCDYSDQVSASASYQGIASQESQITTANGDSSCDSKGDSRSVVDFGNLDGNGNPPLATECTWSSTKVGSNNSITSSDIRFNTSNFDWTNTTSGCSNKFDLESVATHEFGHSFGLGHVSESEVESPIVV